MNFFYFDQVNRKQGPVSKEQLQELAVRGIIGPNTPMETDGGHKGVAGQISGLFSATSPPPVQPMPVPHGSPPPVSLFCTNCGKPVSEKAVACMACGAKPIGHKKFCRQCGSATNPEQVVCVKCGASLTGGNFGAGASAMANTTMANLKSALQGTGTPLDTPSKKRIHFWTIFTVVSYVVFTVMYLIPLVLVLVFPEVAQDALDDVKKDDVSFGEIVFGIWGLVMILILPIAGIAYLFGFLRCIYRLWEEIHPAFARTTPLKAQLFLLVPIFNLYWLFVVFLGLYKDMNRITESYGLGSRFDESLMKMVCAWWVGYAICSLTVFQWLPDILIIGLVILHTIVTISAHWIIRNNMLEFIDIKSSRGQ